MPFDDNELGADCGVWGGLGAEGTTSGSKPVAASITHLSMSAFRAERPDPTTVPVSKAYELDEVGERPPLPDGFVDTDRRALQVELPADFNPHHIWAFDRR
jgi:hypothetical protein